LQSRQARIVDQRQASPCRAGRSHRRLQLFEPGDPRPEILRYRAKLDPALLALNFNKPLLSYAHRLFQLVLQGGTLCDLGLEPREIFRQPLDRGVSLLTRVESIEGAGSLLNAGIDDTLGCRYRSAGKLRRFSPIPGGNGLGLRPDSPRLQLNQTCAVTCQRVRSLFLAME